jgi:hypothetical protein
MTTEKQIKHQNRYRLEKNQREMAESPNLKIATSAEHQGMEGEGSRAERKSG